MAYFDHPAGDTDAPPIGFSKSPDGRLGEACRVNGSRHGHQRKGVEDRKPVNPRRQPDGEHGAPSESHPWFGHQLGLFPQASGVAERMDRGRNSGVPSNPGNTVTRRNEIAHSASLRSRAAAVNLALWAFAVALTFVAAVRVVVADIPMQYHPRYVANDVFNLN